MSVHVPHVDDLDSKAATISLGEAASYYGIGESTARRLLEEGKLPFPVLRLGTRIRVVTAHLKASLLDS